MRLKDQPIWKRRLFACISICIGGFLLIFSVFIVVMLWRVWGEGVTQIAGGWNPTDYLRRNKVAEHSAIGLVSACSGVAAVWIGGRELLACRSKDFGSSNSEISSSDTTG